MKMISRKFMFALAGFALISVVSCSKDDNNPNPGPEPIPTKKLVKIEEDGNSTTTFTYNTDGTFQKITTNENGEGNTMTFGYANAKLSTITNSDGSKISYVYENNKISKAEIFDETNKKVSYNEFAYANGKVASVTVKMNISEEGEPQFMAWMKTEFTYYANGDTKDMTIYMFDPVTNQMEKTQRRSFEQYDTKTNPLAQLGEFSTVFLMDMSARNPLLEKAFDGDGQLVETVTNEYTYDAQGYPVQVKVTTTPANGTPEISNLKYFYN